MNNLPLQPLVWKDLDEDDKRIFVEHAQGAGIFYTVYGAVDSDFGTRWHDQMEGSHGKKEGFESVDDAKHWIATDHYPSKMQPYVKPMPSKVYELTYDYGDGYSTLFMTLDKQLAVDFMDSVKKHDEQFICDTSYDVYEVETIHDLYNDNHPLAPYKDKIFNSIYEDSFSEWMLNYGSNNSFVSSLDIIEHELFSTMQNNKGE